MKRELLVKSIKGGGSYFAATNPNLEFISTGCKVLDLALGGGWVEGRIGNIVGDKSTGKTLLCIEAAANFVKKYPKGKVRYRECEAAFDPQYAQALGMPLDRVDFGEPFETVEDMFEDLESITANAKHPELYILDSLDSLSDRAEMGRDLDEGTYGANKAKQLSQMFRRMVRKLNASKVTVLVVSQVRSKIGVSFGRATTRSGGRALDFYASQVLFLSQLGANNKVISGVKRPIGINIRAKVDKNKVSLPLREAEFQISFGYGIDDVAACLSWLQQAKSLDEVGIKGTGKGDAVKAMTKTINKLPDDEYLDKVKELHKIVERKWFEIEKSFLPTRRKY